MLFFWQDEKKHPQNNNSKTPIIEAGRLWGGDGGPDCLLAAGPATVPGLPGPFIYKTKSKGVRKEETRPLILQQSGSTFEWQQPFYFIKF